MIRSKAHSTMRVRMVSNGSPNQTTARLFQALSTGLEEHGHKVDFAMRQLPRGVWPKLKSLPATEAENARHVRRSTVFIIHTPLALSVISTLLARLLGRRVIAFVWDLHPESTRLIGSLRNPVLLWVYWALERLTLMLSTSIVIPSTDYEQSVRRWAHKTKVVPLWPCDPIVPTSGLEAAPSDKLRIAFAGQINGIRSLRTGMETLLHSWSGDHIELHLFSKDGCPDDLRELARTSSGLSVVEHGELEPGELQRAMQELDAGWVSLDPSFELPAFPSKAMAYLCAGIPVLFCGPPLPGYRGWLVGTGLGLCADDRPVEPTDLADLRHGFDAARARYLRSMEDEWFGLEALL